MARWLALLVTGMLLAAPAAQAVPPLYSGVLPTDARVARAAQQLDVPAPFVKGVAEGLELLYQRRYKECRAWFARLEQEHPGTAVSPVADLLVWQAIMLENFDFRYDDQYTASSRLARQKLAEAMKTPGQEGWEQLMLTVVSGLESIHAARRGRYLPALHLAFEAVDAIEKTRALAPDFVDLRLADGLYNYWRTVVTRKARGIPDFGDKRAEGLAQMQEVVDRGVFLQPAARLAMAFSRLEEREYDDAIALLEANQARYPKNVINELMVGLARLYAKDLPGSLRAFDRVLELDPSNRRVHYYRGLALHRQGKHAQAEAALRGYLAFDYLEPYQTSAAWYRLGESLYAQKRYADAWSAYQSAVKVDGSSQAKSAMDRMKKLRRQGRIAW